jgi:hypothetical protein
VSQAESGVLLATTSSRRDVSQALIISMQEPVRHVGQAFVNCDHRVGPPKQTPSMTISIITWDVQPPRPRLYSMYV